ncbi:chitin binding peritrophin-A domain-containing protein [Aspergillus saccharolyticus JOP 1030-1]|uniref:Chitin-binding type-2 domain-containing protein n=1 Tax=Aspergillus saccharolyticus JOP 1030-1 TaxID=1450539 RepID=A0A318Z7R1_9EURO|nr:hypothetical protein BP01DRAFT_387016 [Aspergillus saccharolyticus JOP 1030-1]PYH40813.1 hypothetical protein BP01DRAFT_387016 [Aspergillus saccharolyticus JOP 1030-1]
MSGVLMVHKFEDEDKLRDNHVFSDHPRPTPTDSDKMRFLYQTLMVLLTSLLLDPAVAADCRPGATRPDRYDCHAYHKCEGGELVRLHCPTGQAYSVYTGTCEPEWRSPGCHQGVPEVFN